MRKLIQLLSLSILLPTALTQAAGINVDVFLLGGQSNAGGRGVISELPDPSVLYNASIMLYHSANMSSGQPAHEWTTLRPASNSAGNFGPEVGFGNRMAELYQDRQIAIIKHAVGGTSLGVDWNPGVSVGDISHFGPQFTIFVETVNSGISALIAQGYTPVIRGMLWQQGERDARYSSHGPVYDRNLSHFIKRVRAQFNAPNMPFVYGQVLPVALAGYDYRDQVRQGQLNVDQDSGQFFATDGARLVLADDLPMNADNLHISAAGQIELGIRFADAIGSVVAASAVDFNDDGIVDSADICMMVDYWHTDEPFFDIAPAPFGDGIVDVLDLIVLSEHLFTYPGAVAYWNLDETEGDIAYDSVAANDAVVIGGAIWQPEGGIVEGALQLDGIDDYVNTPFVLNPADGKFSVFVWIKGGAPGQVVISQKINTGGANWLLTDPQAGALMTELKGSGRSGGPLQSQTVITDGDWHHLGFVWDGSNRTLYVDDVEVAKDTQANLGGPDNGLYIGTGKAMEAGTFWSGLIDDVRIYNRAVKP